MQKANPKISVIMPVYNAEKYLKQSIESILNQTYKDFEFIIINDGSTDNSLNIIYEYANKHTKIKVIARENRGLVCSLNEGISYSKGEYIARIDADDISLPERLEKQIKFFEKNQEIDILGSMAELIGDKALLEKETNNYEWVNVEFDSKDDLEKIFLECCAIPHPSVMMKKEFLIKIGGYFEQDTEDYNLWLRAIKSGFKIDKINEKLIKYRLHDNSKMRSNLLKIAKSNMLNRLEYIKSTYNIFDNNFKYVIWGAGNGGIEAQYIIDKVLSKGKIQGFIDVYKEGKINKIDIFRPDNIKKMDFDYIFICTSPGKEFARKYLDELGYEYIKNYIFLY